MQKIKSLKRSAEWRQSLDNSVFVIGGIGGKGGTYEKRLDSVECLELTEDGGKRWRQLANMSTPRSSHTCEVMDGQIYVVGGGDGKDWLCSAEVERDICYGNVWHSPITLLPCAGLWSKEECLEINSGPLGQEMEVRTGGAGRIPLRCGRDGLAQGRLLGSPAVHGGEILPQVQHVEHCGAHARGQVTDISIFFLFVQLTKISYCYQKTNLLI